MRRVLYLGTDPSKYSYQHKLIHLPLIQTRSIPLSQEILDEFPQFTHVILTSPNAVRILVQQIPFQYPSILAIGRGTAATLLEQGLTPQRIANPESQEGMIQLLEEMPLKEAYLFYPRSTLARPLLASYLQERGL